MTEIDTQRQQVMVLRAIRDKAVTRADAQLLLHVDDLNRWFWRDRNPDTMPTFNTQGHYQNWLRYKQMHIHLG